MNRNCLHLVILAVFLSVTWTSTAGATLTIKVTQGSTVLGTIEPYTGGSYTGAANYSYSGSKNHVINGPTAVLQQGQFFFYEATDGLMFNAIFGSKAGESGTGRKADMIIWVAGSTANPIVKVTDDSSPIELKKTSITDPYKFTAGWNYTESYGDGGVIGAIGGNAWTITVDPSTYTGVTSLSAYSGSGGPISLSLGTNPGDNIVFTPVPIPPALLLFGTGLVGLVGIRRRFTN